MTEEPLVLNLLAWYEGPPDPGIWWWAVEHKGHPAFYLRALMAGDFASGRLPLPRHVLTLSGERRAEVPVCGTCKERPRAEDLEPVERCTGEQGHLVPYRSGRVQWPAQSNPATCWECGGPARLATMELNIAGQVARVCPGCAKHWARTR